MPTALNTAHRWCPAAPWLVCRVILCRTRQQAYDLFIGEVVGAWADDRVFRNGH